jgi:hypothetical protein
VARKWILFLQMSPSNIIQTNQRLTEMRSKVADTAVAVVREHMNTFSSRETRASASISLRDKYTFTLALLGSGSTTSVCSCFYLLHTLLIDLTGRPVPSHTCAEDLRPVPQVPSLGCELWC